jgi:predicted RNA-binding Zn-ribbon protein involved in translation (DUF1610 family)
MSDPSRPAAGAAAAAPAPPAIPMMSTKSVAMGEVQAEYNVGVRQCRSCGASVHKEAGCDLFRCPVCQRTACFRCGAMILSHTEITTHTCLPNALIDWEIAHRTKTIQEHPQGPNAIQVFVLIVSGAAVQVAATTQDTVASLKEKVARLTGMPGAQQDLSYAGKTLKDNDTLRIYNIRNGSTIIVSTPVQGGCRA